MFVNKSYFILVNSLSGKPTLTVAKNEICPYKQLEVLQSLEELITRKPPDQDSFQVSPQVVRTPKQSYPSNFTENCLEEVMILGTELKQTYWSTSQSMEGLRERR